MESLIEIREWNRVKEGEKDKERERENERGKDMKKMWEREKERRKEIGREREKSEERGKEKEREGKREILWKIIANCRQLKLDQFFIVATLSPTIFYACLK